MRLAYNFPVVAATLEGGIVVDFVEHARVLCDQNPCYVEILNCRGDAVLTSFCLSCPNSHTPDFSRTWQLSTTSGLLNRRRRS